MSYSLSSGYGFLALFNLACIGSKDENNLKIFFSMNQSSECSKKKAHFR